MADKNEDAEDEDAQVGPRSSEPGRRRRSPGFHGQRKQPRHWKSTTADSPGRAVPARTGAGHLAATCDQGIIKISHSPAAGGTGWQVSG